MSALVTEIIGATPAVSQSISGIVTYVWSRNQETASELTSSSLNLKEVKRVSKFFLVMTYAVSHNSSFHFVSYLNRIDN